MSCHAITDAYWCADGGGGGWELDNVLGFSFRSGAYQVFCNSSLTQLYYPVDME